MSLFGITDEHTGKPGAYFPVALRTNNVKLTKVETQKGQYGTQIIFFMEATINEKVASLRDYRNVPNKDTIVPPEGKSVEEILARDAKTLNGAVRNYCEALGLYSEMETALGEVIEDGDTFAKIVAEVFNHGIQGQLPLIRVKTVKNNKGYAKLGKYAPFCEANDAVDCEFKYSDYEVSENAKEVAPKGVTEETTPVTRVKPQFLND